MVVSLNWSLVEHSGEVKGRLAERQSLGMASQVHKFSGGTAESFLLIQPEVQWLGVRILTVHWLVACAPVEDLPVSNGSCAIWDVVLP